MLPWGGWGGFRGLGGVQGAGGGAFGEGQPHVPPPPLLSSPPSVNFVKWSSQGMLRMSPEAMSELFQPTITQIINHIGE